MNDPVLDMLAAGANNQSIKTANVILFVSGMRITGRVSPAAAVIRDVLITVNAAEDASMLFANTSDKQGAEVLNLTDVTIRADGLDYTVPFLRVDTSQIDCWLPGAL